MMSPLEIAGNAISAVYSCKVPVEDKFSIDMVFSHYKEEVPAFELGVWWKPALHRLHVGMGMQYDLSPLSDPKKVAVALSRSVEPFLEGIFDSPTRDYFNLYVESDGACVPCYDAYIDYAPLDEGEIETVCRKAVRRGSRMLMLLCSVFESIERGYIPNADERMTLLLLEHGAWEVGNLSGDVPDRGTRLPKGLFGGIGTLAPQ